MSTQTTLLRAGLRRLLDYLKGEQAQIAELRRSGFSRPAEAVEALERLATAIKELGGAPEHKRYIGDFYTAVSALEQRLYCDNRGDAHGPVTANTDRGVRADRAGQGGSEGRD